ncbi:MAG: hypothetical protein OXH00_16750 [Candidatus Poribacteria bacterium]|nr:hypothetical protein [Candidatus Poribacteria bacterium]
MRLSDFRTARSIQLLSERFAETSSDISHSGSLGFTGGGGLSFRVEKGERWAFTPFLGVFYSNWWDFSGRLDHVPTAEVGIEIDVSSKLSFVRMYTYSFDPNRTVNAFQSGKAPDAIRQKQI